MLTYKPKGKIPLGRPRRRWEDSIRVELEEIGITAGNWVDSAQNRDYWRAFVNVALNLRFHGVSQLVICRGNLFSFIRERYAVSSKNVCNINNCLGDLADKNLQH